MIEVVLIEKGDEKGLLVFGHANKSNLKSKILEKLFHAGKDLLCAAISAQIGMLETGVLSFLENPPAIKKGKGLFYLALSKYNETHILLKSLFLSCKVLERQFPKKLRANRLEMDSNLKNKIKELLRSIKGD